MGKSVGATETKTCQNRTLLSARGLKLITAKLERRSLDKPWGLGFVSTKGTQKFGLSSSPDVRVLVVKSPSSNKHKNETYANVKTSWARSIVAGKLSFLRNHSSKINKNDCAIDPNNYLAEIMRAMADPSLSSLETGSGKGIFPGDMILAIDGRPLSSPVLGSNVQNKNAFNGPNITSEIASYLRQVSFCSLMVLRHTDVVYASACVEKQKSQHDPLWVSSVANMAWDKLLLFPGSTMLRGAPLTKNTVKRKPWIASEVVHRNPWFRDENKTGTTTSNIPYSDNTSSLDYWLYLQEDGSRAGMFLPPLFASPSADCEQHSGIPATFHDWLSRRKLSWRNRYNVYQHAPSCEKKERKPQPGRKQHLKPQGTDDEDHASSADHHASGVAVDFWTQQGLSSFQEWLRKRSTQWHRSYSWNRRKRQKIEQECFEKVVHLPFYRPQSTNASNCKSKCNPNSDCGSDVNSNNSTASGTCSAKEFEEWLKVRRYQWRMSRRKRRRERRSQREGQQHNETTIDASVEGLRAQSESFPVDNAGSPKATPSSIIDEETSNKGIVKSIPAKRKLQFLSKENQEIAFIDDILEEREKEKEEIKRQRDKRPPIDIARFFDASQGIPDDIVVHCLEYLDSKEHRKLFAITKGISKSLRDRPEIWRQLCPNHWVLPRRPRKPWHELYFTRLRKEREQHQKRWDDLLVKCSAALFKRDDLQKIEKIVEKAEKDFGFDLNYASGVVCERNSILNLAVIHGRHKVVRWLVDVKGADIETSDRGNFTPLLNAAWSGDRWLVRFLLQRQSDRNVLGTQHYTQGIAPIGFRGRTADEWADKRGHPEVAKLIRLGL
ncbi:unnamed protein product [Pseudo-nitzschia multistriata]|uniref:Uncharacterized protein n=1 Tax=Pseudo-nitzschia multistriata TaxID=183589 RepID=A0A448Z466_9STRA|nr:unnamed protein product [Pseudo-nitzschia multistriata]